MILKLNKISPLFIINLPTLDLELFNEFIKNFSSIIDNFKIEL